MYSRAKPNKQNSYDLRTAGAGDDVGDRPLFAPPDACQNSTGRPAWSQPDPGLLVVRCRDVNDTWSLLLVDVEGTVRRTYKVLDPAGKALNGFGDYSLSPDGRTIVLWANSVPWATGGALYTVDVDDGTSQQLLDVDVPGQYSDPVFSPDGSQIAYRSDVDGNYEIFTAPFSSADRTLGTQVQLTTAPEKDEDPSFSPDGSQIAYSHSLPGGGSRIYVVDTSGDPRPRPLLRQPVDTTETVPMWTSR